MLLDKLIFIKNIQKAVYHYFQYMLLDKFISLKPVFEKPIAILPPLVGQ